MAPSFHSLVAALTLGLFLLGTPAPAQTVPDDSLKEAQQLFIQGLTEAQTGDYEAALPLYEKALKQASDEPALLFALAEAYAAQGEKSTALLYAQQAAQQGDRPYYLRQYARMLAEADRPDEAAAAYERALERFPSDPATLEAFAVLQEQQGNVRQALRLHERMLRIEADSARVYQRMVPLYNKLDDPSGQERVLRTLLRLDTETLRWRAALARLLLRQDRPQEAITVLEESTASVLPASHQKLLARARRAADPQGAEQNEVATSPEALLRRAEQIADAQPDEATQLLQRALEADSTYVPALALLGQLRYRAEAYAEAADLLGRVLETDPRDPAQWHRAAEASRKSGQPQQAYAAAEEGLLLFPGHLPLLETAARAALNDQAPSAALAHANDALQLLEDTEEDASSETKVHFLLLKGDALLALDRPDEAAQAWETAQRLAPQNTAVQERLQRLPEQ